MLLFSGRKLSFSLCNEEANKLPSIHTCLLLLLITCNLRVESLKHTSHCIVYVKKAYCRKNNLLVIIQKRCFTMMVFHLWNSIMNDNISAMVPLKNENYNAFEVIQTECSFDV